MRTTIHMVSAADFWPMVVGTRRVRREWFEKVARTVVDELDTAAVAEAVRSGLSDQPLPMKQLTERLVRARLSAHCRAVGRDVGRPREGSAIRNLGAAAGGPLRTRGCVAADHGGH